MKSLFLILFFSTPFIFVGQMGASLKKAELLINEQKCDEAKVLLDKELVKYTDKQHAQKSFLFTLYAKLHQYDSNSQTALKYCYLASREARLSGSANLMFRSSVVFAEYYRWMDDLKMSKKKLSEAETYLSAAGISLVNKGYYYNRKAAIKSEERQIGDTVIFYSNKALGIYKILKDSLHIASTLNEIGYAYHSMGQFEKSLVYYFKAMAINRSLHNRRDLADIHVNVCRSYHDLKKPEEIIKYALQGLALTDKADPAWHETSFYLYQHLAMGYDLQKNYFKAYETEKIATDYHLKFYSHKYDIATKKLEANYEVEKGKIELEKSKNEKRLFSVMAILGGTLSVLLVFFLLQLLRNLKKSRKLIVEKEFLVKEVHHRVKNNLQSLSSLVNLHVNYASNPEQVSLIKTIVRRVEAIGILHGMLYQSDEMEFAQAEKFFKSFVEIICELNTMDAHFQMTAELDIDSIQLNFDECIALGSILSELITNSAKYAFNETGIRVYFSLKRNRNHLSFSYHDNGMGEEKTNSIPDVKKSLGIKLIDLFTHKIGATNVVRSSNYTYQFNFVSNCKNEDSNSRR